MELYAKMSFISIFSLCFLVLNLILSDALILPTSNTASDDVKNTHT